MARDSDANLTVSACSLLTTHVRCEGLGESFGTSSAGSTSNWRHLRLQRELRWLRNQKLDFRLRVTRVDSGVLVGECLRDACISLFPEELSWDVIVTAGAGNHLHVQIPRMDGAPLDPVIDLPGPGDYQVEIRLSWGLVTIYRLSIPVPVV